MLFITYFDVLNSDVTIKTTDWLLFLLHFTSYIHEKEQALSRNEEEEPSPQTSTTEGYKTFIQCYPQ